MNDRFDLTGTSMDRELWPKSVRDGLCTSPLQHHMASPEAMAADILQTRCIGCRRRIYRADESTDTWRVRDDDERSARG